MGSENHIDKKTLSRSIYCDASNSDWGKHLKIKKQEAHLVLRKINTNNSKI